MARWRFSFYKLVPSWLSSGDGEKVLFALGVITDAFIERARRSLTARFPTYSGPTGLRMLGEERGIIRGRAENQAGYARRLREWRGPRGHLVRGTPFAMLRQIWNYFDGVECQELDASGNVFVVSADGSEAVTRRASVPHRFNWDGVYQWFRFWVRIVVDDPAFIAAATDTSDIAGHALGIAGMTAGDADTVRKLFTGARPWKMAGTKAEWLIVEPRDAAVTAPDGTWGHWSKNDGAGTQVPARDTTARYVSLNPTKNNVYSGVVGNFPKLVTMADGSTYAGTVGSFPGTIATPGGGTGTGTVGSFPATVQLLDDGSAIVT